MIVRFGYVAMSVHIQNASPSKTMTFKSFSGLEDRDAGVRKLERIAAENLQNTLRLLKHNKAEGIRLYRMSSKLIPLMTHETMEGWDPFEALEADFRALGTYAIENGMRLSFHPDHFTVLSTPREDVFAKSVNDLDWHVRMLERMGLDERYKCNIHIGGTYGDKAKAFDRFVRQFESMPARIRHRITLENDDKTFTAKETLEACRRVGVPMVLDIHHHWVNNDGERAEELWPDILETWEAEKRRVATAEADGAAAASSRRDGARDGLAEAGSAESEVESEVARRAGEAGFARRSPEARAAEKSGGDHGGTPDGGGTGRAATATLDPTDGAAASSGGAATSPGGAEGASAAAGGTRATTEELLAPKIHVSSPKSDKDPRGHADYVDADAFLAFARAIAPFTPRLDVMIEAKRKDDALFRLVAETAERPGVRRLGGATVEL